MKGAAVGEDIRQGTEFQMLRKEKRFSSLLEVVAEKKDPKRKIAST